VAGVSQGVLGARKGGIADGLTRQRLRLSLHLTEGRSATWLGLTSTERGQRVRFQSRYHASRAIRIGDHVKSRESRALATLAPDPCAGTPGNEGEISISESSFSLPVHIT
jgi:hypothetical protein